MSDKNIKEELDKEFSNNSLVCNLTEKYFEENSEDFDEVIDSYIKGKINEID